MAPVYPAPHRACFAAATLLLGLGALWWWAVLSGWWRPVAGSLWHGLWMTLSFLPLFFGGFLQTQLPRWLRVPAAGLHSPGGEQALVLGLMVGGWCACLVLLLLWPDRAGAGLLLVAGGWCVWLLRWWAGWRRSAAADRLHATALLCLCSGLALVMLVLAYGLLTGHAAWVAAGLRLAWWAGLLPVFLVAAHRMLPFFAGAQGAAWPLPVLLLLCAVQGGWDAWQHLAGPVSGLAVVAHSGLMAAGAALAGWLAWRWWRLGRLGNTLVRLLWVTWLWLPLALALGAWPAPGSGLLALHASAAGFAAGTWLLMISRLSAGLAGQAQAVDSLLTRLWVGQQTAAVLRVLAGLPGLASASLALRWGSATLWLSWCLAWGWRQARVWRWRSAGRITGSVEARNRQKD
jgi:uncharacterized protein involved in response to NO